MPRGKGKKVLPSRAAHSQENHVQPLVNKRRRPRSAEIVQNTVNTQQLSMPAEQSLMPPQQPLMPPQLPLISQQQQLMPPEQPFMPLQQVGMPHVPRHPLEQQVPGQEFAQSMQPPALDTVQNDYIQMDTLVGTIFDVSESTKICVDAERNQDRANLKWMFYIFEVIDDLVECDVPYNNCIFFAGVGSTCGKVFDILRTMQKFANRKKQQRKKYWDHDKIVKELLDLLESNGAKTIRKYAHECVIKKVVSKEEAEFLLNELQLNKDLLKVFVNECLPFKCRDWGSASTIGAGLNFVQKKIATLYESCWITGNFEDVKNAVEDGKSRLLEDVNEHSIFQIHEARRIIKRTVGSKENMKKQIPELVNRLKYLIFGKTQLNSALQNVSDLFLSRTNNFRKKVLFIISDGEHTDVKYEEKLLTDLKKEKVIIVGCYFTREHILHPKKLFSNPESNWSKTGGAHFLFDLCSTVPTQLLPHILFKRGWKVDNCNDQTKLFVQINQPDNINYACELAKTVICCEDALYEHLGSISLVKYINQPVSCLRAKNQENETCYANASATVIHLAMKRIIGRDNGYPDFETLRKRIIEQFGSRKTNTLKVLKEICPKYRLECREIDIEGAMEAIAQKRRPVVATFGLTCDEWDRFNYFYSENKTGILTKSEIDISKRHRSDEWKLIGHAVVLCSYSSCGFRFMNSWGDEWGDMGFFRVQNAEILNMKFIDVNTSYLTQKEKEYYKKCGNEEVKTLMSTLKFLQNAEYECRLCKCKSLVHKFSGTLSEATCPKCKNTFRTDEEGNIIAIDKYFTTLASTN